MTAKVPLKVHLRLRFGKREKPRTAGLCGRAAGACDCGPLSCTKIERPSPLEKPSCKVRLFAQNRSREYRQEVTVTTLFPTAFQLLPQTAHVRFHERKWVHTRLSEKDCTQGLTRRNRGRFGWGWYHYSRSVPHVHQHPRAGYQNGKFCRFWGLVGGCSQRTQKAFGTAMRLCASLFRGVAAPLGCVICLQLGDVAVFSLCAQYFLNVQGGRALSLPSERFTRFGNPAWPGVRTAYFAAFGAWSGVLPKNAESLRDSDALMRVAVPRRRGPAGLRDLFATW